VTLDKQGRILISARLRQYAELDGDCVILGIRDRIEIWSKAAWEANIDSEPVHLEKLGMSQLRF
jgi:MraZ protein